MEPKNIGVRKSTPTSVASSTNERVTARIVRESDGTTHHEYQVGTDTYGSLEALSARLRVGQ